MAANERSTTVELVIHRAEFEARQLHLELGFPSLFVYCREVLHLSEHGAYNRIEVARTSGRFPVILDKLRTGALNLATARLLVWLRDGGRCAFTSREGRRCSATALLEFHHRHLYAAGGPATTGNIELRCRAHNAYEADLFFGAIARARTSEALRPGT